MAAKKKEKPRVKPVYTPERKQEAITIALATTAAEASRQTGIPAGTIRAWRNRKEVPAEAPIAAEEAIAAGKEKAVEIISERLSATALKSFKLAEKALGNLDKLLNKKSGNRDTAAWLRSVSTTFGTAIDKALLLAGRAAAQAGQEITDESTAGPVEDGQFIKDVQDAYNQARERHSERSNVTPISSRQVAKG